MSLSLWFPPWPGLRGGGLGGAGSSRSPAEKGGGSPGSRGKDPHTDLQIGTKSPTSDELRFTKTAGADMEVPCPPFVLVLEDCNVRYEGRARAEQRGGTLIVVAKEDGTVVLHNPGKGIEPQFYNPEGELRTWRRADRLYLVSQAARGEQLRLNGIPQVIVPVSEPTTEDRPERRYVRGVEHDLAQWISANPEVLGMENADVSREVSRTGGRVDLLFSNGAAVEVKKNANVEAYDQARRYLRDEEIEGVVIACLDASSNLRELCSGHDPIRLVVIDEPEFRESLGDLSG